MTEVYVSCRCFKCLALLWRELVEVPVDLFHCAVLRDELACADFSDAFHSRDIVRGVTADGEDLDYLFGSADVVFFAYLPDIDDFVVASAFARLELVYVRRNELTVVFVRSHHIYCESLLLGSLSHGSHYVIRLEARYHQHRDLHCPAELAERFERVDDQLRRL